MRVGAELDQAAAARTEPDRRNADQRSVSELMEHRHRIGAGAPETQLVFAHEHGADAREQRAPGGERPSATGSCGSIENSVAGMAGRSARTSGA